MLRVADRFGCGVDGALRHLGFPPPTPRQLRAITLRVAEVAGAEDLYRRWEVSAKKNEQPEFTADEMMRFQELLDHMAACPGCGGMPGECHADGCPADPANWPEGTMPGPDEPAG